MTDPARETTTQATRVEWESGEHTISHVERNNDRTGDYLSLGWKMAIGPQHHVTFDTSEAPNLCAAIDTISGGAYRAMIEREVIAMLMAKAGTLYVTNYDEDGFAEDHVWDAETLTDWLRAQQPSDQHATQTQGVEGE